MKPYILIIVFTILSTFLSTAQNLSDGILSYDTRNINDLPNFTKRTLRLDFKRRSTIGVPGRGEYSGNITISPWGDVSGNSNHQINFNDGGIYYRSGSHANTTWNHWRRIALTETDGSLRIGDIGDGGNREVPIGSITAQYNIDFTGYRDVRPDQIGARISAYRINRYQENKAYIQKTGLSFHTNPKGDNEGIIDLKERMRITPEGNVGIGTSDPKNMLDVAGTISAREIKVEISAGADHVFSSDYDLKPLSEVANFIQENKHLPEIPSEKQMKEEGLNMNQFQIKLLQKIEELTLYVIAQNKQNQTLQTQIEDLKKQLQNQ